MQQREGQRQWSIWIPKESQLPEMVRRAAHSANVKIHVFIEQILEQWVSTQDTQSKLFGLSTQYEQSEQAEKLTSGQSTQSGLAEERAAGIMDSRLPEVERQVADLLARVSAVEERTAGIMDDKLPEVDRKVEDLTQSMAGISPRVSAVEERMDGLTQSVEELRRFEQQDTVAENTTQLKSDPTIEAAFRELPPLDRKLIDRLIAAGHSQREIAARWGRDVSQVSRLHNGKDTTPLTARPNKIRQWPQQGKSHRS